VSDVDPEDFWIIEQRQACSARVTPEVATATMLAVIANGKTWVTFRTLDGDEVTTRATQIVAFRECTREGRRRWTQRQAALDAEHEADTPPKPKGWTPGRWDS